MRRVFRREKILVDFGTPLNNNTGEDFKIDKKNSPTIDELLESKILPELCEMDIWIKEIRKRFLIIWSRKEILRL